MNNGFVKVAAATPKIKVGDCGYNGAQICKIIDEAVSYTHLDVYKRQVEDLIL